MALAIHFDDLARLGGVTCARITQIINLLNLPPWTQEELLFLEGGPGRDGVTERERRSASADLTWDYVDGLGKS